MLGLEPKIVKAGKEHGGPGFGCPGILHVGRRRVLRGKHQVHPFGNGQKIEGHFDGDHLAEGVAEKTWTPFLPKKTRQIASRKLRAEQAVTERRPGVVAARAKRRVFEPSQIAEKVLGAGRRPAVRPAVEVPRGHEFGHDVGNSPFTAAVAARARRPGGGLIELGDASAVT